MKRISAIALAFAWLACAGDARAVLVGYWNMDANTVVGKLSANSGSQAGSLSGAIENIGLGYDAGIDPLIAGTTANIVGAEPLNNRAIGFYRIGTVYSDGSFTMSGFNFTGVTGVAVSFAYESFAAFTWDINLEVDYRINNGAWQDIPEDQTWGAGWTIANITFAGALDGQSNVDLRIREVTWLSSYGSLDIDNVQVNAVPEPGGLALVGLALAGLVAFKRRARSVGRA